MGLLNLSAEKPTAGSLGDANQIANAFTEIEAAVNSIDESNFSAGQILELTKLKPGGATTGQSLTWDGSNWAPGGGAVPVGALFPFVGTAAQVGPGFLLCDGVATVLRNSPLGVLLAGRFGPGNGVDTWSVPNLKGRIPIGFDSGDADYNTLGKQFGDKRVGLVHDEMPLHGHNVNNANHTHGWGAPVLTLDSGSRRVGTLNGVFEGGRDLNVFEWPYGSSSPSGGALSVVANGSGVPHHNVQPCLVFNYIIKT